MESRRAHRAVVRFIQAHLKGSPATRMGKLPLQVGCWRRYAELSGDARKFRGAEVSARPRRAPEEKRQNALPCDAEACPSRSASTTLTRYHRRRYPENSLLDASERLQRADGQTRPNRGQRCVHPGEATGLVQRRK